MRASVVAIVCVGLSVSVAAAQSPRGYQSSMQVTAPTRLDTVFPLANQSLKEPPADWYKDYDSTQQKYELFVPPSPDKSKMYGLVLFISAGASPAGQKSFQAACQQSNLIFASAYSAGNDCPGPRRVRIVLDVLDDVRRRYPIDPDRTYMGGFSGGGRIACNIAFALPELFGGVLGVCASEQLREESWLRQRVADRLSVALLTGETDFNRGELERLRGPYLTDVGVRAKVWTVDGMGHSIPASATLVEAVKWLEAGLADRQKLARAWPASRIAGTTAPTREQLATALQLEGQARLKQPATLYSGLMQLVGVSQRWGDTPAAAAANKTLDEYERRTERPWEADDISEQRRFLVAEARALTAYATGPLPGQYTAQRPNMVKGALERWQTVLMDQPTGALADEARKQIAALAKVGE